jgi:hypothetical protein
VISLACSLARPGKCSAQSLRRLGVSLGSFFGSIKKTQVVLDATYFRTCSPFSRRFIKIDPANARRAVVALRTAIGVVLGVIGRSKIVPAIVITLKIPVVDLIGWPFARHVKPSQSRRAIASAIGFQLNETVPTADVAGQGARIAGVPLLGSILSMLPMKEASDRIIGKHRSDESCRKVAFDWPGPHGTRLAIAGCHVNLFRGVP